MSAKDPFSNLQLFTGSFDDLIQVNVDQIPLPKDKENLLQAEDVNTILEYLKNPTKAGVWTLHANWLTNAGLSKYIWEGFNSKLQREGQKLTIRSGEKVTHLTLKEISDIKSRIFHTVSLSLSLFTFLYEQEVNPTEGRELGIKYYNIIANTIDLEELKTEFADAYTLFKEEVYFSGFKPTILSGKPFLTKNGIIYTLDTAEIKEHVIYYSLHPTGLKNFATFLSRLDKIEDVNVMPTFSPEEEVLRPYFLFAQLAYSRIINDERLHPLFTKSFGEYEANRFESSISTLGLIGEDFLTQIYETLFREPVPKGQTMGQLYDLIQARTAKLFQKAPPQPPDIDSMYKVVNEQIGRAESESPPSTVDALKLIRQAITLIKEERAYSREVARENQKQPSTISVFPTRIRENVNDLIRFRNAASHKSRVPLSDYEALRTLHCLISLIVWWHSEIRAVEWNDDSVTIIKKMTERSAVANT